MLFDIVYVYIYMYLVLFSDFCDQGDGYIRGDNSVCESPSGDDGTRTGLVVGSLLSSVLVLVVWIILVCLQSREVISEINKYVLTVHTHTCIYIHAS